MAMQLNLEAAPVILLEGADCVGKTTMIRRLQDLIPKHNLVKLSGDPLQRPENVYMRNVYLASTAMFHNSPLNTWLIDRYTPSERVYGKIYRGLTPEQSTHLDWAEEELSRRNGHYFLVVLNEADLATRLAKKVAEFPNERHGTVEDLIAIQNMYMATTPEIRIKQKWLVHGNKPLEEICLNILAATGLRPDLEVDPSVVSKLTAW